MLTGFLFINIIRSVDESCYFTAPFYQKTILFSNTFSALSSGNFRVDLFSVSSMVPREYY